MNLFTDLLYFVTSGLLLPCIAYLLVLLVQSLMAAGRYAVQQRHGAVAMQSFIEQLHQWEHHEAVAQNQAQANAPLKVDYQPLQPVVKQLLGARTMASADFMVTEYEVMADKGLSRFAGYAKLGPILGLMGTLIPMGPALQGLASGDIAQLANQMQVAFTTTVVGLMIGVIGFVLYQYQRRQVARELSALELLVSLKFGRQ